MYTTKNGRGDFNMTLGERLRYLRERRGITQEDLAKAIKLTKQAISK